MDEAVDIDLNACMHAHDLQPSCPVVIPSPPPRSRGSPLPSSKYCLSGDCCCSQRLSHPSLRGTKEFVHLQNVCKVFTEKRNIGVYLPQICDNSKLFTRNVISGFFLYLSYPCFLHRALCMYQTLLLKFAVKGVKYYKFIISSMCSSRYY